MNERIKELYVQANRYANLNGLMKYDKADNINWEWEDTVFEKFAELIVQECCDFIAHLPIDTTDPDSKMLAQHFGVKYERAD